MVSFCAFPEGAIEMELLQNKKRMIIVAAIIALLAVWGGWLAMKSEESSGQETQPYKGHGGTFKNTLADMDTPDPSIVYQNGYYYMAFTHNGADVMLMKSRTLDFKNAVSKVVWYPPVNEMYSANLWAPEIQYLRGKWYIYFAADNGVNENHRMYALEADTDDPFGTYTFKGQVGDDTNKWAIDGLALEHEGKLYFVWSGWEDDVNIRQNTYIAPMSDPVTISGPRVLLSEPDLEWERQGGPPYINEGQAILHKDGRVFIMYSGAGSWTPFYSLGLLSLKPGADPLVPGNWEKSAEPLLVMDEEAGVFGPGHNTFVTSPDGSENWIVYHATSGRFDGWSNRKARAQRIDWNEQGLPVIGKPLSLDTAIAVPSGSGVYPSAEAARKDGLIAFDLIPGRENMEMPLLIHYRNTTGSVKSVDILVNGDKAGAVDLPETPVEAVGYAYSTVKLPLPDNTIAFPAPSEGLQIAAFEIPRYEAENAQAQGEASAESNPFAAGWGIMKLGSADGDSVIFSNLSVPERGRYKVRLAVSNPSGKEQRLDITANGATESVKVPVTERNQFKVVETEFNLRSGSFEIKLEETTGQLMLDYMDLTR